MFWDDFLTLIKDGENYNSKFFASINEEDELGPTLIAMANTKGGHIAIGFDIKNYHLRGTPLTRDWLNNLIKSYCNPQPEIDVSIIEKSESNIMVISLINNDKKPYYYKNKCYVLNLEKSNLSIMEKSTVNDFIFKKDSSETEETLNNDLTYNEEDLALLTNELEHLSKIDDKEKTSPVESDNKDDEKETDKSNFLPKINADHNLNQRQQKALQYIFNNNSIKNKTYRDRYNVSHKTAHLELVDLVKKNLISSQGSGRSTCYILNTQVQQILI